MPNYCGYSMKVVGKVENLDRFASIIKAEYNYNDKSYIEKATTKHFSRIFAADIIEEERYLEPKGQGHLIINGECAWSTYSCMLSGEHTYYDSNKGHQKNVTCLEEVTKELELTVEIISSEPGMCFNEHIIVKNGEVTLLECKDIKYVPMCEGKHILKGVELAQFMDQYYPCERLEGNLEARECDCPNGEDCCEDYVLIESDFYYENFTI